MAGSIDTGGNARYLLARSAVEIESAPSAIRHYAPDSIGEFNLPLDNKTPACIEERQAKSARASASKGAVNRLHCFQTT